MTADTLQRLLDALVEDLANGINPKLIAVRHRERLALERELDEETEIS